MKDFIKFVVLRIITWEAKLVLAKHKPFIIGVTGNLGKTSTKDAIYAVMKQQYYTRRSEKSMNSEFGVPLTILGQKSGWNNPIEWMKIIVDGLFVVFQKNYPTHIILEIGADRPGDIKTIAEWIKPDITVVTQFGQVPVHIEFFPDRDAVVTEKGYLVEAIKEKGVFIFNADDHDALKLLEKTQTKKVSFGIHEKADIKALHIKQYGHPIQGTEADIVIDGKNNHVVLPEVAGKSPVYCALPALAVARELSISLEVACAALRDADKPRGRMRLLRGMNGSVIIDDTYNASPKATEHGLKTLNEMHTVGRKIAVIGDMLELGTHTRDEHYKIGLEASKCCHKLYTVGIRARTVAEGALDGKMNDEDIMQCDTAIDAGKELVQVLGPHDIVYMKGSQGVRMERTVKMILAETHDPKQVLVRQEKEWLNR
ncbi:MAG: UDP-N-acetylmuramoyl-tripeptide--D-alanyl-D-alanine ligase [Candidatus Pacebacteria bacterium]|nr:UDP-N-acetylmuramoyl-tripeptide--D-alanyl-D-alanine ligase [Candidatus Paceibacterota bacterium]MBP9866940.1 UDP-N-acetylmuramoyl-tripeptide--D-alanyl-D-alanine ligase [Candidatus Paceibacterota bacterium]